MGKDKAKQSKKKLAPKKYKPSEARTKQVKKKPKETQAKKAIDKIKQTGIPVKHSSGPRLDEDPPIELKLNGQRNKLLFTERTYREKDETSQAENQAVCVKVLGTSKKFRQVVLLVQEPKRTLKRQVTFTSTRSYKVLDFAGRFPVWLPEGTKYSGRYMDEIKPVPVFEVVPGQQEYEHKVEIIGVGPGRQEYEHKVKITARVPDSSTYFLIGYDEDHLFVCVLPKPVTSVTQAHQVLMPPALRGRKDVIRQGEFFFVPVTKQEENRIRKETDKFHRTGVLPPTLDSPFALDMDMSDHMAMLHCSWTGKEYVMGPVGNERHYTMLPGWHRVVRNLEVPSDNDSWD